MGRPAGPPEKVRRNRLTITVTDAELEKLQRKAAAEGRPFGTVAYELFSRALKRIK